MSSMNFLIQWNRLLLDYWWRKKYKVPFGSSLHREINLLDVLYEYNEEITIKKLLNKIDESNEANGQPQFEIDEDYDSINLDNYV